MLFSGNLRLARLTLRLCIHIIATFSLLNIWPHFDQTASFTGYILSARLNISLLLTKYKTLLLCCSENLVFVKTMSSSCWFRLFLLPVCLTNHNPLMFLRESRLLALNYRSVALWHDFKSWFIAPRVPQARVYAAFITANLLYWIMRSQYAWSRKIVNEHKNRSKWELQPFHSIKQTTFLGLSTTFVRNWRSESQLWYFHWRQISNPYLRKTFVPMKVLVYHGWRGTV